MRNEISIEENEDLSNSITMDELKRAVFNMHPNKAPGLDGFTLLFYQKNLLA